MHHVYFHIYELNPNVVHANSKYVITSYLYTEETNKTNIIMIKLQVREKIKTGNINEE